MSLLKRLKALFTGASAGDDRHVLAVHILTHRCREPVQVEINLRNELSPAEEPDAAYFVRKLVLGSGRKRCFDRAEVLLWFDQGRKLLRHQVQGGRWLSLEEYQAELERFNAPPPSEEEEEEETSLAGEGAEAGDQAQADSPPADSPQQEPPPTP